LSINPGMLHNDLHTHTNQCSLTHIYSLAMASSMPWGLTETFTPPSS